uniref:Uncharacterized protein n=1 Tax=Oryza sativa subsp. japonica TaxID=39947 RepID=Q6ZAH0_ORYSJ|nr:hypothetical protein [Oryza sativa Japonica Group]
MGGCAVQAARADAAATRRSATRGRARARREGAAKFEKAAARICAGGGASTGERNGEREGEQEERASERERERESRSLSARLGRVQRTCEEEGDTAERRVGPRERNSAHKNRGRQNGL